MNHYYRLIRSASFALALSFLGAPSSQAAASFVVHRIPSGARVMLNGRPVATIWTANLGMEPEERAALAVRRLEAFLGTGGQVVAIRPRALDEGAGVYAGDTLVMVATGAEARAQQRTPWALADRWARDLRAALTLPPVRAQRGFKVQRSKFKVKDAPAPSTLNIKPGTLNPPKAVRLELAVRELVVPVGESRAVRVIAPGAARVETGATATFEAELIGGEVGPLSLRVRGLEPGKATLRVTCGAETVTLPVVVMRYAARIPAGIAATVTGRPCPVGLVRETAAEALRQAIAAEPGATVTLGSPSGPAAALAPDQKASVKVPVVVTAPGCLPLERTVTVPVTNRLLDDAAPRVLLYSNHPESLGGPGSLFLAALERDVPTRLLYHHQNMMGRPIHLRVDVVNLDAVPAEVQVIEGAAGPSWDTVMVGHRATARYVRHSRLDVGAVVSLAPGTRRTILSQRMADKLAVSGLYGLRLLSGKGGRGRVMVEVVADDAPVAPREAPAELAERPLSDHIYTTVRKELDARFAVGGSWTFINVGKKAIRSRDARKELFGNYGVLYDIDLEIENPTEQERVVSVSLSPDAGFAMGVFLIDGLIVEAPSVSAPAEATLASFRLKPGERRKVPIQTIPVGGSAYPVSLVVRAGAAAAAAAPNAGAAGG